MEIKELRTTELSNAYAFLCDFSNHSQYQEKLKIVLDTLDFALVRLDSTRENYNYLVDKYCELLEKTYA